MASPRASKRCRQLAREVPGCGALEVHRPQVDGTLHRGTSHTHPACRHACVGPRSSGHAPAAATPGALGPMHTRSQRTEGLVRVQDGLGQRLSAASQHVQVLAGVQDGDLQRRQELWAVHGRRRGGRGGGGPVACRDLTGHHAPQLPPLVPKGRVAVRRQGVQAHRLRARCQTRGGGRMEGLDRRREGRVVQARRDAAASGDKRALPS